jgi:hypothetical protein
MEALPRLNPSLRLACSIWPATPELCLVGDQGRRIIWRSHCLVLLPNSASYTAESSKSSSTAAGTLRSMDPELWPHLAAGDGATAMCARLWPPSACPEPNTRKQ